MTKKPNYYKNHFGLTGKKLALLEIALDVTISDQRILKPLSQTTKYHDKKYILKMIMSVYEELDHMVEHRTQFAFKGKREHIAKVNMLNIAYLNQHIEVKILHGSRDHVIIPDTVNITFNFYITSTDKARSIVSNVGRALAKKSC